jgi:biotin operon repressor
MTSLDDNVTADVKFSIVPEWLIDSGCSDKALRLYVVLARYADNDDLTAYPGRGTLAKRMGCHRASVDRAVEELIALGAVTKQRRVSEGKYQSSLYTIRRIAPSRTHATTPVAPVQRPPLHPCDIELEPENIEPENSLAAAPQEKSAKKDELFEAVAQVCGIDWTALTKTGRGPLNKAVKELREIGVTPDQVGGRAAAYRKTYPDAPLTPMALTKHWASLAPAKTQTRQSIWETYDPPESYY